MMNADFDPFALAARKYKGFPGNPERVYRALCYILSDRIAQVDWDAFTADDWRIFKPMAEAEGVAPLVWWKLRRWTTDDGQRTTDGGRWTVDGGQLSVGRGQELIASLAPSYYATLARNTILLKELERILTAFERAGIEVIVLKGAALTQMVYEDIGLRPMSDIDLLVRPEDVRQAWKIFSQMGYCCQVVGNEIQCRGGNETLFEIHWTVNWLYLDFRKDWAQEFWQHTEAASVVGYRVLCPAAALVYIAAHLGVHYIWQNIRLIWLVDLWLLGGMRQSTKEKALLLFQGDLKQWTQYFLNYAATLFGTDVSVPLILPNKKQLYWRKRIVALKVGVWSGLLPLNWQQRFWLGTLIFRRWWPVKNMAMR